MRHPMLRAAFVAAALLAGAPAFAQVSPVQVYGAWHCGSDFCTWSTVRSVTEFDAKIAVTDAPR